ncbi:MAG TPA: NADH-quinone oxidoreductase subunit C [Verrucomicrobiae bacterium]|nr:NADH-quinone oxidoreductase subunit C [Verrucomicrobiae bacterium]
MNGFIQALADEMSRLCQPAPATPPPADAPAGETPSAAAAEPPPPCQITDYGKRGFHLDVTVPPDRVVDAAHILDARGFGIDCVTGVDWIASGQMEVVYDYFHPTAPWRVVVRARIPRDRAEIQTVSHVFPGANWHERETHDFFDIRFIGHPDLSPFLLPEDSDFHPLRKDFTPLP